ncbi:MAG: tRNA (adenine-N1)-methyltransferase [Actinobacteria bacterium]|nr:tRNA (adenine-N1)-methyltransferase [Actinomycetota bacterium]
MTAFEAGERILFVDARDRTYLVRLQAKGTFHTHGGALSHDLVIGRSEGVRVETGGGMALTAFRPRFADYALKMPRGAQVIYPKDIGPVLMYGDVFPGARVLEAGTGSGALTIALARAVGAQGRVVSYELRPEHRERGVANVEDFYGAVPAHLELREGDVREVAATGERFDRAVLDLPQPWDILSALGTALEPGAVLCCYLPTTVQVQQVVLAFEPADFQHVETFETLQRSWHVTERSVRPDHRMVGHTGFLTVARLVRA